MSIEATSTQQKRMQARRVATVNRLIGRRPVFLMPSLYLHACRMPFCVRLTICWLMLRAMASFSLANSAIQLTHRHSDRQNDHSSQ